MPNVGCQMYVNVFLMVFSCLFTPEGHPPGFVGDPVDPSKVLVLLPGSGDVVLLGDRDHRPDRA
jgi:TATA-box binding protein (TBP) (component of TFIID and TFIIIB)